MPDCSVCGETEIYPYRCNYCDQVYCSDHRLPKNHRCSGLSKANTHGPDFRGSKPDEGARRIGPQPIEPDYTVGTTPDPNYAGSPDVEYKSSQNGSALIPQSLSGSVGLLKAVTPFVLAASLLVIGVAIATGALSAGDYLGHTGEDIDNLLRSDPEALAVDTPHQTPVSAGESSVESTQTPTPQVQENGGLFGSDLDRSRLESMIHREVNDRRKTHGLKSLDMASTLRESARDHSRSMVQREDLYHGDLNFGCSSSGENVAKTWYQVTIDSDRGDLYYSTPEELANGVVNQWMNSTDHRENLLRSRWDREGIGVEITVEDGNTAIYVTQRFC